MKGPVRFFEAEEASPSASPADKAAEKVAELKLEECPLETEEIEASGAATGENGTDQYAESNEGLGAKGKPKKKK